jgi:hypothetical protein
MKQPSVASMQAAKINPLSIPLAAIPLSEASLTGEVTRKKGESEKDGVHTWCSCSAPRMHADCNVRCTRSAHNTCLRTKTIDRK